MQEARHNAYVELKEELSKYSGYFDKNGEFQLFSKDKALTFYENLNTCVNYYLESFDTESGNIKTHLKNKNLLSPYKITRFILECAESKIDADYCLGNFREQHGLDYDPHYPVRNYLEGEPFFVQMVNSKETVETLYNERMEIFNVKKDNIPEQWRNLSSLQKEWIVTRNISPEIEEDGTPLIHLILDQKKSKERTQCIKYLIKTDMNILCRKNEKDAPTALQRILELNFFAEPEFYAELFDNLSRSLSKILIDSKDIESLNELRPLTGGAESVKSHLIRFSNELAMIKDRPMKHTLFMPMYWHLKSCAIICQRYSDALNQASDDLDPYILFNEHKKIKQIPGKKLLGYHALNREIDKLLAFLKEISHPDFCRKRGEYMAVKQNRQEIENFRFEELERKHEKEMNSLRELVNDKNGEINSLNETIDKQNETIDKQNEIIDKLNETVEKQNSEINSLKEEFKELKNFLKGNSYPNNFFKSSIDNGQGKNHPEKELASPHINQTTSNPNIFFKSSIDNEAEKNQPKYNKEPLKENKYLQEPSVWQETNSEQKINFPINQEDFHQDQTLDLC